MDAVATDHARAVQAITFDKTRVGGVLKTAREHLGATLKEVESASGISASHIWNIESGKKDVTTERILKLACFYGFNPGLLLEVGFLIDRTPFAQSTASDPEFLDLFKGARKPDARRQELLNDYVTGCAIILTYILRSTRPSLLIENFPWPNWSVKNRFRIKAGQLEYRITPKERMRVCATLVATPFKVVRALKLYDDDEAEQFLMSANRGQLPFQLPWNPVPKPLLDFSDSFKLEPHSVEERRFLNELQDRATAKVRAQAKARAQKRS